MHSSGFETRKRRIKPPRLDKGRYTLAELSQCRGKALLFFLCVSYQRVEGKFRSSELKGTLKF